jgi:hypothetical protein
MESPAHIVASDRWHKLLTTRYICQVCLTRYFQPYKRCPACRQIGHVRPLLSSTLQEARTDREWRELVVRGPRVSD